MHVAVAGTSLAFFPLMLVAGTITLVWRMKLADMVAKTCRYPRCLVLVYYPGDRLSVGKRDVGNLVGMDR